MTRRWPESWHATTESVGKALVLHSDQSCSLNIMFLDSSRKLGSVNLACTGHNTPFHTITCFPVVRDSTSLCSSLINLGLAGFLLLLHIRACVICFPLHQSLTNLLS